MNRTVVISGCEIWGNGGDSIRVVSNTNPCTVEAFDWAVLGYPDAHDRRLARQREIGDPCADDAQWSDLQREEQEAFDELSALVFGEAVIR